MKNVLVFYSFKKHKTGHYDALFTPFVERGSKYGLQFSQGSLKDIHIIIKDNQLQVIESMTGKDLKSFEAVHFNMWDMAPQQALAAALYLQKLGIPTSNEEPLGILAATKVGEIARMADHGVALPNTFISSNRETLKVFKANPLFDYPFIAKAAYTFGGKMNYLVKNYQELEEALLAHPDQIFVLQEFIPNNFDYRVLVMGGKIRLVMKRERDTNSKTHLNNTSQGAAAEIVPVSSLSKAMQRDALKAAELTLRSGFSGVDLIINSVTGQHYILEVNNPPAIQVGLNIDEKMSVMMDYLKELSEKSGDKK